jgi:hypothetical protein
MALLGSSQHAVVDTCAGMGACEVVAVDATASCDIPMISDVDVAMARPRALTVGVVVMYLVYDHMILCTYTI